MAESKRDTERLRALLEVARLVSRGVRGRELLEIVATTVADTFGFGIVVLNLHRPAAGDFEAVVVHGDAAAGDALLGAITTAEQFERLMIPRFEIEGAYFVQAGAYDWIGASQPSFIPELEPVDDEDAWQPQDALLVPLRHSEGELLGVLSLDAPKDGLRPSADDLAVLSAMAAHLAQAVESARANQVKERLLDEVRDAEHRYRSLVERLPAVVYRAQCGERRTWYYVGPQIETVLGFTPSEWLADGELWLAQVHRDDRDEALAQAEQTRLTLEPLCCEYRMLAKDGRLVWIRDEAVVLEEADGPVLQGVMYDITDQKQAQEAIRRQSHLLEQTVRARTRELDEMRIETLERLAFAAEFRDDETHQHTQRVGRLAALLAGEIGLPNEQIAVVRHAATLHDIGKLGVPDAILLKRGKLTAQQRARMQTHTTIGARILAGSHSRVLRMGEEIALTHHERWDGWGYPHGIAADAIPIVGRLVAIADVFDALTHTRPYKEVWPLHESVAEIERLSGTYFDPRLVEAFVRLDHELLLMTPEPLLATPG
jgi:PAS domain S-box-containing protein/putative nucleotidyltransferase with HDIG domain